MKKTLERLLAMREELQAMKDIDVESVIELLDDSIYEAKIYLYGYDPDCPDSVEQHRIDMKEDYQERDYD